MLPIFVSLVVLSSAAAVPIIGNFHHGGVMGPAPGAYPGYYTPVVYRQQLADGTGYEGTEQGYKRLGQDVIANEVIRDVGAVARQDSDSRSGGHLMVKGGNDARGYYRDDAGSRYKAGGNVAAAGETVYSNSEKDGYGGFGSDGHRKGHKTTGFHKSYHNVESGKDTKFVDEDHDIAHEDFGKAHGNDYTDKGWKVGGSGLDEDAFVDSLAHKSAAGAAARNEGAHKMAVDGHDGNGYYHNRDLAYKRGQGLAQDHQVGNYGYGGVREASEKVAYPGYVW